MWCDESSNRVFSMDLVLLLSCHSFPLTFISMYYFFFYFFVDRFVLHILMLPLLYVYFAEFYWLIYFQLPKVYENSFWGKETATHEIKKNRNTHSFYMPCRKDERINIALNIILNDDTTYILYSHIQQTHSENEVNERARERHWSWRYA